MGVGFDTCFTFLARGSYTLAKLNWILVKVFFGSGYLGFVSLPLRPDHVGSGLRQQRLTRMTGYR